jgi:hypothetical protein
MMALVLMDTRRPDGRRGPTHPLGTRGRIPRTGCPIIGGQVNRASPLRVTHRGREDHAMQIVAGRITVADLTTMAEATFGDLVKAAVDVGRGLLAVDAGMHSDLEALLLDAGSRQGDIWGINLYPGEFGTAGFLEFDSMINLRPSQGNRTRSVDDPAVRTAIVELVGRVVVP